MTSTLPTAPFHGIHAGHASRASVAAAPVILFVVSKSRSARQRREEGPRGVRLGSGDAGVSAGLLTLTAGLWLHNPPPPPPLPHRDPDFPHRPVDHSTWGHGGWGPSPYLLHSSAKVLELRVPRPGDDAATLALSSHVLPSSDGGAHCAARLGKVLLLQHRLQGG